MATQSPTPYPSRAIEPFRPSSPFLAFYHQANRLFEDVLREFDDVRETMSGMIAPSIDITQTDRETRITAELPGVKEEDVDVSVDHDVLTIRAEKRMEHEHGKGLRHVSERAYGTFQRSLRLPQPVPAEQIRAHFDHGVLTLLLPRMAPDHEHHHIAIASSPPPAPAMGDGSDTPH
ncbi:MAG TPA: Hsp20/alpha crystallin family protein [Sphingobium sp.]|nr:Hsp20/alpha crystallin family protein [Sphingobium sp.]